MEEEAPSCGAKGEGMGSRAEGWGRGEPTLAGTASIDNSCYLLRASPAQTSIYWAPPVCQARCPGRPHKCQPAPALPRAPLWGLDLPEAGWFHFTEEKTEIREQEGDVSRGQGPSELWHKNGADLHSQSRGETAFGCLARG